MVNTYPLVTPGMFISGAIAWGVSSGVQGEAPVQGLGDKVLQKLKQFADIVYRF